MSNSSTSEVRVALNPQELRIRNRKNQKNPKSKPKSRAKTPKKTPIGEKKTEEPEESKDKKKAKMKKKSIVLNKELQDIKDEASKAILPLLSKEIPDEASLKTAKSFRVQKPPSGKKESEKITKLLEFSGWLKDLKAFYTKKSSDADEWHIKYEKRIIDLTVDMNNFERKIKAKITKEMTRVNELEHLAAENTQKRRHMERFHAKMAPCGQDPTLVISLTQTLIDVIQSLLYYSAVIRDVLFTTSSE